MHTDKLTPNFFSKFQLYIDNPTLESTTNNDNNSNHPLLFTDNVGGLRVRRGPRELRADVRPGGP